MEHRPMNNPLSNSTPAFRRWRWISPMLGKTVKCIHLNAVTLRHPRRTTRGHQTPQSVWSMRASPGQLVLQRSRCMHFPISYWADSRDWQQWTISTFEMLNPPFRARPSGIAPSALKHCRARVFGNICRTRRSNARMLQAARWNSGAPIRYGRLTARATGRTATAPCATSSRSPRAIARLIDFEIVHQSFSGPQPSVMRKICCRSCST